MSPAPVTTSASAATPAPKAVPASQAHTRLMGFLQILLALAPAIAAPFIPAGTGEAIFQAEVPIEQEISSALAQSQAQ